MNRDLRILNSIPQQSIPFRATRAAALPEQIELDILKLCASAPATEEIQVCHPVTLFLNPPMSGVLSS
jgi:hypothetical protein